MADEIFGEESTKLALFLIFLPLKEERTGIVDTVDTYEPFIYELSLI